MNNIGEDKIEIETEASNHTAIGKLTVNLFLNTQLLDEHDSIVKCDHCNSPVVRGMIPDVKFDRAEQGITEKYLDSDIIEDNPYIYETQVSYFPPNIDIILLLYVINDHFRTKMTQIT